MQRLTIGGRLACGVLGAVGGAVIGFFVAWILGVYSHIGPAPAPGVNIRDWVLLSAAAFGLVGILFGPYVGDLLGAALSLIYEFERPRDTELPGWLVATLILLLVVGVWWWMT